ncbi:hypothetical protein F5B22DRAFT_154190 [Xylaria bambusicola]|uniref:uncharacterized protein n=1 Tax=Xylaria bambusicola TaxID=326684 RepID=UPI0020087B82|nr:uncharacterized protein F5B22DRAFT_154190 [Xylaria bambusicola]KAI0526344.1 hypothetical protein F5B22DRAFT_154190 [Xylaria bambusicola]
MTNTLSIGELIWCRSTTIVGVIYGTDGQLTQNVISGPKVASDSISEEGVYILHGKRGLQIAAACERRTCDITQICRCAVPGQNRDTNFEAGRQAENISPQTITDKGLYKRIVSWLRLYKAAYQIRCSKLCFLAYPRTLSWDSILGSEAFHFDHDLEEHYSSIRGSTAPPRVVEENPQEAVIDSIADTWSEFLASGEYCSEKAMKTSRRESSEWQIIGRDIASDSSDDAESGENPSEGEERPAPVITPPKNMNVGRGLE